MNCTHKHLRLINPYEIIWKYKCLSCGEVMMCSCESEIANYYVPHQTKRGKELESQNYVPVTFGFQKNICKKCRGEELEAYPKNELYGASSKIKRYYWREIVFTTLKYFKDYAEKNNFYNYDDAIKAFPEKYKEFENKALQCIKHQHDEKPLYDFHETSQAELISKYNIDIINYDCEYKKRPNERKVKLIYQNAEYTAEDYAATRWKEAGYSVVMLESIPFHFLFGTFMYQLIQDDSDPCVRFCSFGDRVEKGKMIYTLLPSDFGTAGYYMRRQKEIKEYFNSIKFLRGELLWLFDYWSGDDYSGNFRQYLWATDSEAKSTARELIEILPSNCIKDILFYLIKYYWKRYCGWPDLLCYRNDEYILIEVKSSNDKLSIDQKNWIKGNFEELQLPFKIAKLHKQKC